ncbi:MAG: hypothetical protein WBO92_01575 [Candidatus Moraniibacteriota bacterium]
MKNSEAAFRWIIEIFKRHGLPFVVLGGLAARAYGSTRELNDIDLVIHRDNFERILPEVREYITFGPEMSQDEEAEGYSMVLQYKEQDIDIGAEEDCKIFNQATGQWELLETDFNNVDLKEVFGITVPVMKKEAIITEKLKFNRPVDHEDIKQMQS